MVQEFPVSHVGFSPIFKNNFLFFPETLTRFSSAEVSFSAAGYGLATLQMLRVSFGYSPERAAGGIASRSLMLWIRDGPW